MSGVVGVQCPIRLQFIFTNTCHGQEYERLIIVDITV